jgi:hypothetical protein
MNIGLELYERLKNITQFNIDNTRNSGNNTENHPNQHLTRVTLYSGIESGATSWQYALVTVGGILIVSILTSGKNEVFLWHLFTIFSNIQKIHMCSCPTFSYMAKQTRKTYSDGRASYHSNE